MPVDISACFVPVIQFACSVHCELIYTLCAAYLAYAFHIMSYVMSVMLPWSCLLIGPDFGHISVGPCCMLHCISVHKSPHAFRACHCCPRHCGVRHIKMRPFCASQQAASQFSHRLGTSTHSDSQQEQLQRARHEPVLPCACLWTSTCLCLTALFRRASTHILRASYFADIGIPLTQPPISALRALCLRSWSANWTVSLDLTVSSRCYDGCISSI